MAFASSVKEVKGEGNLPKLVLTSTHGRYVFVNCIQPEILLVFSGCCHFGFGFGFEPHFLELKLKLCSLNFCH